MARFTEFEPTVSFRYALSMAPFDNIKFLCKAVSLPKIDQGEIVIDYINTDFKVKGKSRWQDVTLQIYDAVGHAGGALMGAGGINKGANEIHEWLNTYHHNSDLGTDGWAFPNGTGYKRIMTIQVLPPAGSEAVYRWVLYGAFIQNIDFGEMDWAAEDAVIANLTIKYDYAIYKPGAG